MVLKRLRENKEMLDENIQLIGSFSRPPQSSNVIHPTQKDNDALLYRTRLMSMI